MEKRISLFTFQSAKIIYKTSAALIAKRDKALKEAQSYDEQVKTVEKGIFESTGFRVEQLVKKVVEKGIDSNGKETKATKYIPTDIVTYDESTKEYVITIPNEEKPQKVDEAETIVPPTTEDGPGTDYDEDVKKAEPNDIDPLGMEDIFN